MAEKPATATRASDLASRLLQTSDPAFQVIDFRVCPDWPQTGDGRLLCQGLAIYAFGVFG